MSSSVLRNVIHPRPTGSGPLADTIDESEIGRGGDDMERVMAVLVENAPVAMAMFDQQMRYLLANRAWVEEFGLGGVHGLIGRSQFDVFPSLHPGWRQVYERALQGHVIRSEHDALSGPDGRRIVYRWEVRPWRRQVDASVGGLMIICERFGHGETPPESAGEDNQSADTSALPPQNGLADLAVPMVVLNASGVVQQANAAASNVCLARGLKEGETEFWEAFGDAPQSGLFKQQVLSTLESLVDHAEPASVIVTVPITPATQSMAHAAWGIVSAVETSTSPRPTRWMVARSAHGLDEVRRFTAVALPPEPAPRVSVPTANLPAIANAVATISQPPVAEGLGNSIELRRLQDDLARAKQELRTLHEAERTFALREARLKQYLDSLPFGVLVLNELSDPLFQNQPLTRLLGRSVQKDETVEQWLAAACPNDQHRDHVATLWREDVWRRQLTRTFTLATADGLLKDLEFQPASLPGGGLLVSIQDATEKVRHEEQLRATEAKFRALLQESPLPIVLMDKAGSVFEVNHLAEELFGHPKNELRRHPLDRWFDEESSAARVEAVRDLQLRSQRSTMIDVHVLREDYDPIPVHLHLAQVMDSEGEPHCTIHFFELEPPPVIVEVPAHAQVAEMEHISTAPVLPVSSATTTHTVTRQIPTETLLFKTNVNGRIKACTERGLELLGLAENEALGRPLHQHFRPSDATGFYADLSEYAQDPRVIHNLTCFSHTGARHPVQVKVEPLGGEGFDFSLHEIALTTIYDEVIEEVPVVDEPEPLQITTAPIITQPAPVSATPASTINLEREKLLLSETHHRIKNHLQIISSLLNLESNTITETSARNALRSSQNRVRSIADLHQHLYQIAVGSSDSFCDFAVGLLVRLRECYAMPSDRIPVHFDLEAGAIQQEWLMPLALTLNETLSNCFEHAFPDGRSGEVHVSLRYSDDTGELIVTDNGIGLTENATPTPATGLGLKILAVFAEQMRGQLLITRPGQGGTEIRLKFPMNNPEG
jgi:PAS domain S-box-containing protein